MLAGPCRLLAKAATDAKDVEGAQLVRSMMKACDMVTVNGDAAITDNASNWHTVIVTPSHFKCTEDSVV